MTYKDDLNRFGAVKDFFVLIPVLGTAIAVTFDVGYFAGIDLNLFTFFSLSEHIVFVLEVFPLSALGIVVGTFLAAPSSFADGAIGKAGWRRRLDIIVTILGVIAAIFFGMYYIATVLFVFALATFFLPRPSSVLMGLIFLSGFMIAIAFSIGHDVAVNYVHQNSWAAKYLPPQSEPMRIETKGDGVISGWLMRSGERGVLYVNKDRSQVSLLRWDEIKQISVPSHP